VETDQFGTRHSEKVSDCQGDECESRAGVVGDGGTGWGQGSGCRGARWADGGVGYRARWSNGGAIAWGWRDAGAHRGCGGRARAVGDGHG